MANPKRWELTDRFGNRIYLTEERWQHIVTFHPEMAPCEAELQETVRSGPRRQEALDPDTYRYRHSFDNLPAGNSHIVAVVRLGFTTDGDGRPIPNNFVVTAFPVFMGRKI